MFNIKKVKWIIIFSIFVEHIFAQKQDSVTNVFIEPEIQYYFESTIGYKKNERQDKQFFRNSPISVSPIIIRNAEKAKIVNIPAEITGHLSSENMGRTVNYDNIPLYYDLKIINTAGPLSSYVLEPSKDFNNKVFKYEMVDLILNMEDVDEFYNSFLKKIDFFMAGEQEIKDKGKPLKIIFGWISYLDVDKLRENSLVKGYYFSQRKYLKVPLKDIVLIIKAPANRNMDVFLNSFLNEIKKNGFEEKIVEKPIADKKSRFSLIKIIGRFPIDKIDRLMTIPFVFKLSSTT